MTSHTTATPILPAAGVRRNTAAGQGHGSSGHHDDGSSTNPSGRDQSDFRAKATGPLLKCKKLILLSPFNAFTIREESRPDEMALCSRKCRIDILGVQLRSTAMPMKTDGMDFITSSGWRNIRNAAQGGMGLLLSRRAIAALRGVHSFSLRVLVAEFDATKAIVCYSPHNCSEEADVEQCYADLRVAIGHVRVPAHKYLAMLGDFNARLGPEDARYTYHTDDSNRNGQHLVSLLQEHNILAANTLFQKRRGKIWTFEDKSTEVRRQLDFILVRHKWPNSVLGAQAYSSLYRCK